MDPSTLWLSSAFAAAKVAIALWTAQLALSSLDRRRATVHWHLALALLAIAVAWWAMRTDGVQSWWRGAWLTGGILGAASLVECLRRWLAGTATETAATETAATQAQPPSPAPLESWRVIRAIASVGWLVSLVTTSAAVLLRLPSDWLPRAAGLLSLVSSAGLLGITIAASLELTLGPLGSGLVEQRWRTLARWATLCFGVQLVLGALVIFTVRATESPTETAAPFLFAFGMMVVGYIAWSIPSRMARSAGSGAARGQASLAVAGWLTVLCLAIASALPPAWPWNRLDREALQSFSPLAIIEQ